MSEAIDAGASDRVYAIACLKRQARTARLQAGRAAPFVARRLHALATLIDAEAQKLESAKEPLEAAAE